jgi:DNA-binding transcriptional regulator YhcF (GntR family)
VRRGEGTYVADEPSRPRKSEKHDVLREAATRYASSAIAVGAEADEAAAEVESAYQRVVRDHRRR